MKNIEFTNQELRNALEEQLLLQYGSECKDLDYVISELLKMREERIELDTIIWN